MPITSHTAPRFSLVARYKAVRQQTDALCAPLSDADATIQSMEDASPAKWHLAHTTWFFETFILLPHDPSYRVFSTDFNFLFNSYYDAVGARHPRPKRGMLSRPTLDEIKAYRRYVDDAMHAFLQADTSIETLVALGLQHEQQHQELLLTDILHAFSQNPLKPAFCSPEPLAVKDAPTDHGWTAHPGGLVTIGVDGNSDADEFSFDCERPAHKVHLTPFKLKNRAVTNGEWKAFIADGGYDNSLLWLSDGWAVRQQRRWNAPLYWQEQDGDWFAMTLRGWQPVDDGAPVAHLSYYEADAYATWAGHRLPREAEWETIAKHFTSTGSDSHTKRYRPAPQTTKGIGPAGLFGDVWEWTCSAFLPYPGFLIAKGAVGEYNGKFMSGQMVLRGGSCATPQGHCRPSYRNFFHPDKRWQFSGLRLASDQ